MRLILLRTRDPERPRWNPARQERPKRPIPDAGGRSLTRAAGVFSALSKQNVDKEQVFPPSPSGLIFTHRFLVHKGARPFSGCLAQQLQW
jgi:hypothetical protein